MKTLKNPLVSAICYSLKSLLTAAIFAGFALIAVYAVPSSYIKSNIQKSALTLINEQEVPRFSKKIPGAKQDNFTSSLMLNTTYCPLNKNSIYNAFANPRADFKRKNQPANLFFSSFSSDLTDAQIIEYPRYWHGYVVVLKPVLTLLELSQIRILNYIVQTFLLIIVCFLILKRLNKKALLAFLIAVFFINPVSLGMTLQYSSVYYITLLTLITILKSNTAPSYKAFLWAGIATSFFDILTSPLLTLGFPLIISILLTKTTLKTGFIRIISFSAAWTTGYAVFWSLKWIIASLILQKNIISDGIKNVLYRTSGNGTLESGQTDWSAYHAISANLAEIKPELAALAILVSFLILTLSCFNSKYTLKKDTRSLLLLVVGTYPFLWYSVVINHSIIHPILTYRILAIAIFALIAAYAAAIQNKTPTHNP